MIKLEKYCYLTDATELVEGSLFMGETVSLIEKIIIEGHEYFKIITCNINFNI
jgi:hypothetical protein